MDGARHSRTACVRAARNGATPYLRCVPLDEEARCDETKEPSPPAPVVPRTTIERVASGIREKLFGSNPA